MNGHKDYSKLVKKRVQDRSGRTLTVYVDPNQGKTPRERAQDERRDTKARQDRVGYAAETDEDRKKRRETVERHLQFEAELKEQRRAGKTDVAPGRIVRVYAKGKVNVGGMIGKVQEISRDGKTATVVIPSGSVQTIQIAHLQIAKSRAANGEVALAIRSVLARGPTAGHADLQSERASGTPPPKMRGLGEAVRLVVKAADRSGLVAKVITNKLNRRQTVYVRPDEAHAQEGRAAVNAGQDVRPRHALAFVPHSDIQEREQYTAKKDYDRPIIDGIKESIRSAGYNPAFPLQVDEGKHGFDIVSGHHRFVAVKELIDAKELPADFRIPVIVQRFNSTADRLMAQVAENVRRQVKPTDEARAFGELAHMGVSAQEIAKRTGKEVGAVNRRLALNNLSRELHGLVEKRNRSLPIGIAEAIGMHGLKPDGTPDNHLQMRAFKFFSENRMKGWGAGEVISYMNELKSAQSMKLFEGDGKTEAEKEALRAVGSEEKARRNVKLMDDFMKNVVRSFQKMFGDSIHDLDPKLIKELAASAVAANGEGGFDQKMRQLGAVIHDLDAVKRSLEGAYSRIRADAQTADMFTVARAIRFLDLHEQEGLQIMKSVCVPIGDMSA